MERNFRLVLVFILLISTVFTTKAQPINPNSTSKLEAPVGKIFVDATPQGLRVCYDSILIMQIHTDAINLADNNPELVQVNYAMPLGKKSQCNNAYREATYVSPDGAQLQMRIYNDGIAFRNPQNNEYLITVPSINHWLQRWTDAYEEFFPCNRVVNDGERYAYPALYEFPEGVFALLTESCIDKDNAATSFYGTDKDGEYVLRADGHEMGGWQTIIIGNLADVVESTLVTDNSEPCKLMDTSWVAPGVASWVYWAYNHGSNDYEIIKRYVDMASELQLPYVLIDAEWDEMKDGKTVEDAVNYAISKGVKPMIWYNSSVGWVNGAPGPKYRLNNPEDREREFAWCEKIGVCGVKIDFFSGDTNLNMRYMIELLESAADHHLLVNFHGATIPRGWQRTYPNLISTEGVYGAEWYNNVPTFTDKAACHNATLPFTRNVVGSMDYTPCAFTDSQHPHITTHAHELALTALYESGIQHLADRPESFLAQPAEVRDYLTELPTAWDETRFLAGYPGDYVVLARRRGDKWYVAGINGADSERAVDFSLSQLGQLGDKATLFCDADKASKWDITHDSPQSCYSIICKPRGGFVMVID